MDWSSSAAPRTFASRVGHGGADRESAAVEALLWVGRSEVAARKLASMSYAGDNP